MRLVYITLARKILCYGNFPAKVSLGTNAYNSQNKNLRKWVGNKEDSVVEASWKSSFSSYFTTMGVQGTNDKM